MIKPGKNCCLVFAVVVFISMISISACNDNNESLEKTSKTTAPVPEIKELVFDKLAGTWKSEDGKSFEQWTKKDDGTYQARAYSVKGADTSWNEQANIYRENENWVFENTVKGQNHDRAVRFTSTILNDTTVQFSNPQHDFPTDINYTVADANTLNAFIIGPNKNGGKDTIPYNFIRIK